MKFRIEAFKGVIDDIAPYKLPPEYLSSSYNIRFANGKMEKNKGWAQVFGTNPIVPYWAMPFNNQTSLLWIYPGASKIYVTDMGGTHTNITRQTAAVDVDYSATQDQNWNGGILGGEIPILNNGVDPPQSWSGNTGERCQNLKYNASQTWADVSYKASVVRTFKQFLFALDVTKNSTRYPNLVKWSSSASAGSVPDTWDESDSTRDAGETYLSDSVGFIVDALGLSDNLIIYGEGQATGCQYIGGNFVFRFFQLFNDGILTRRCVKAIKGHHIVLALNDLIIHDGHTPRSLVDGKRRSWLLNNIDQDNYERSFIVPDYRNSEILVCFPQTGSSQVDTALVWNYKDDTLSERELPSCNHIAYGIVDPGDSIVIDDQSQIIDTDTSLIDSRTYNPTVFYPLICGTNFYQMDSTEQKNGTNMTAYAERLGMDFGTDQTKHIKRVIPRMSGSGAVTFKIGSQRYPEDSVNWKTYTFTPGSDWKIDVRKSGRLISYRFESSSNITWDLDSVEFEYEVGGDR